MPPNGFIDGQDESICYVNSPFQVLLFNIFLRRLIMNMDYENFIEHTNNSENDYRGYVQKIMILQVIQQIFCEMLIGGIFF